MPRRIALAALALLAAATSPRAAEVSTFTLDNGLEVVVLEDHRAAVAVHMVWYRVGSADEARGRTGIAHFLEHLMFDGTEMLANGEFSRIVTRNGGSDNAFTSQDYTAYFQRVAADRLELMMEIEADRMTGLAIDAEAFEAERAVVLEERNTRVETEPGALLAEQRRAAQYLNHPYGIPIIGWRHEIEALSVDAVMAFYRRHYAPNNAILVVGGDVTPDQVRRLAEKHYGPIPANPDIGPRTRVAEPPQLAERRLRFSDPRIADPYVMRTYLAPERDPGDQRRAAALTLLAEVLGGSNTTSVLARKLQFDTETAVYTSAFYDGTSLDDTTFGLIVVPSEGVGLDAAEAALDGAIAALLEEGIDDAQLARIRTQVRASLIYAEDDIAGIANRYGRALTSGLTVADVKTWPGILDSVTEQEVLAEAKRLFDRRRAVTAHATAADGEVSQ